MLVFGPLSGALGSRLGHRFSLLIGCGLATAGLLLIAEWHRTDLQVSGFWFVVTIGIGFAFAAMPNLIVASVPQEQTGQATGFNAVVRSVGNSVGTQVTAVILASSAVGAGLPRESGFRNAFLLCAAVSAVSCVLTLLIPRTRAPHRSVGEEIGSEGVVAA
jgi:MFS family permease